MGKAQSPLLGFNNNVKHRGRVFHIQTEDSGIKYPHVITHLFADGGRILKSVKTSYAEYLDSPDLQDTVRDLMKEQHKSMFIALRDGQFDDLLEDGRGEKRSEPSHAAVVAQGSEAKRAAAGAQDKVPPKEAAPIDGDVLERAAAAVQSSSTLFGGEDMPPPPPAVLSGRRPSGSYRALGPDSADPGSDQQASRYSATRPASIFGTAGPSESSGSVFGEDLISGKSLDEVILSFLAEEFGTPSAEEGANHDKDAENIQLGRGSKDGKGGR